MKERPILFNGEMVKAILDGRKTQTRRVIKPQPDHFGKEDGEDSWHWNGWRWQDKPGIPLKGPDEDCPHGQPGERLWVRETWAQHPEVPGEWMYRADRGGDYQGAAQGLFKWSLSIHMPRCVSRITLEIESVCVERVQEITPDDCRAEGMPADNNDIGARYCFGQLWNSINEKRGHGWEVNPWVWVITFRRVK